MPTLTPTQRKAYNRFQDLWAYYDLKRSLGMELFKDLCGYEEVPYFMSLDVPDAERIYAALDRKRVMEWLVQRGKETGTCAVCNRTLSDPVSVAAGIGPECAKRFTTMPVRNLEDLLQ